MNTESGQINPLDISFSNQKCFQASTPSSASPDRMEKNYKFMIRSPEELFGNNPNIHKQNRIDIKSVKRCLSIPSKLYQKAQQRGSKIINTSKPISLSFHNYEAKYEHFSPIHSNYHSFMLKNEIFANYRSKQHKISAFQIVPVQKDHWNEIKRLDKLINRIQTHLSFTNKLQSLKKK